MGALEASRDMETGQVASRAVPLPGPMEEQGAGTRAAKADPGARAAKADPGTRWPWRIRGLMADPGTWVAMEDQGSRRPWRIRGLGWPWQIQGQWRIRGISGHGGSGDSVGHGG